MKLTITATVEVSPAFGEDQARKEISAIAPGALILDEAIEDFLARFDIPATVTEAVIAVEEAPRRRRVRVRDAVTKEIVFDGELLEGDSIPGLTFGRKFEASIADDVGLSPWGGPFMSVLSPW